MIKAFIFDLDGIIVDSEPLHFEAAKKALQEYGIHLTLEEYLKFGIAQGSRNLFEKLSEKYGVSIDMEKAFTVKKDYFNYIFAKKASPRKGVVELIRSLNKDYVLAIASSGTKESVYFVLKTLNIEGNFKVIVTAEDVKRVKPFPDLYTRSCHLLNLKTGECIAIEDSETGLKSAKAAGLRCIIVPCEFTKPQNFSAADLILDNFSDLNKDKIKFLED
jgi:HAD superfamily hydrolase (TIGR01509 family)